MKSGMRPSYEIGGRSGFSHLSQADMTTDFSFILRSGVIFVIIFALRPENRALP